MTTYTPKREKRYDEIIAEGKQHEPLEVMKAVITDLVLAEACLAERDAEIERLSKETMECAVKWGQMLAEARNEIGRIKGVHPLLLDCNSNPPCEFCEAHRKAIAPRS